MLPLIDTQISTAVDHFQCFSGSDIHNITRIKHALTIYVLRMLIIIKKIRETLDE